MIVLDTCAIIWDALDPSRLSPKAKRAIDKASQQNTLLVSDISFWEIAMLIRKGRLQIDSTAAHFIQLFLQSRSVTIQPISPDIADLSVNLPDTINPDPADRIIVATAMIHHARLVTADENLLKQASLQTIW
jgi:PIN domain nuclease of toxin-antitoxin system